LLVCVCVRGQAHPAEIRCLDDIIGKLEVPPCNCYKCKAMAPGSAIVLSPGARSNDSDSPPSNCLALAIIPQQRSSPACPDDSMNEFEEMIKDARALVEATFIHKNRTA
jgi:hypothetical protein